MKKICGIEKDKIRKAFFTGKVNKLLNDIQALGDHTEEDFNELYEYLEQLKKKDEQLENNFSSFLPKVEIEAIDTVIDELTNENLSEAEMAELEREKKNRTSAVQFASKMLKRLFIRYNNPNESNPKEEELMDIAFQMLGLEYYLIRDAIYKERLYRRRIIHFERAGKQRKTAEEYAKTETEYREYVLAEGLKDLGLELINLAKKRYKNL